MAIKMTMIDITKPTERDYIYLAGCIDSDGSFGVYLAKMTTKHKLKNGEIRKSKSWHVRILMQLENKYKTIPEFFHRTCRGSLFPYTKTTQLATSTVWKWSIDGNKRVIALLEKIEPFLRLKKLEAQEIIANKDLLLNIKIPFSERLPKIRKLKRKLHQIKRDRGIPIKIKRGGR